MCAKEKLEDSRLAREGTRAGLCTKHLSPSFRSLKDVSEGAFLGSFSQSQALPLCYVREEAGSVHPRLWEQARSLALSESGDSNTVSLQ